MVPSQLEEPHGPSSECHWALAAREGFKGVMGHLESRQFWGWISIYNLSGLSLAAQQNFLFTFKLL